MSYLLEGYSLVQDFVRELYISRYPGANNADLK